MGYLMDRLRPLTDEELAYKEARSKGLTGVDQVILPSEVEERARCDEKVVLRSSYYDDRPGGVKMVKHPVYMPRYLHSHRFVELTWIASGSVEEELEGKDITAVEGDVVMIMPGYYHSIWTDSEDTLALNFLADPAFFASLDERFSLDLSACSHAVFGPVDLEAPVEYFLAEREKCDEASPFAMEVAFERMLLALKRSTLKEKALPGERKEVFRILSYLEEHSADVTLTSFAEYFRVSEQYASRLIREKTGSSFSQIVKRLRMEQAAKLLRTGRLSAKEVGGKVGYSSPEHFSRTFKAWYGIGPDEWRKRNS